MKKLWMLLILSALLLIGTALAEETMLYPIRQGGLWGYMDRTGTVVIPCQWKNADFFSGGVAIVTGTPDPDGPDWMPAQGLIDAQGNLVLDTRYSLEDYENIVIVRTYINADAEEPADLDDGDCLVGYYDKASGFFLPPQYAYVLGEGAGLVTVERYDEATDEFRIVYLRADTGEVVIPFEYEMANYWYDAIFYEGYAMVSLPGNDDLKNWRLIDETGAEVSFPEGIVPWTGVEDGVLIVTWPDERNEFGLARPDGTVLLSPVYDAIVYLGDGLFKYRQDNRLGLMDLSGGVVLEPRYTRMDSVVNGYILAFVRTGDDARWDILDTAGRVIYSDSGKGWKPSVHTDGVHSHLFMLEEIVADSDDLLLWYSETWGDTSWEQRENRLYGLMRIEDGQAIDLTDAVFEWYGDHTWAWQATGASWHHDSFHEGLMPAKQDGLWGYINEQGEWVIPPQWDEASHFLGGLALVCCREDGAMAYIDRQGTVVWQETP